MKIGFIGVGKLGMPCAEVVASKGHSVNGYDVSLKTSNLINIVDSIEDCVKNRDIVFIAVPTPHDPLYDGSAPTQLKAQRPSVLLYSNGKASKH